jgi:hypothetical protein
MEHKVLWMITSKTIRHLIEDAIVNKNIKKILCIAS